MKKCRKITMRRAQVLLVLQLLLVGTLLFSSSVGTLAYLTDSAEVTNDFTVGAAKVVITETDGNTDIDPTDVEWGDGNKTVNVSIPEEYTQGVVRVLIVPVLKDASGNIYGRNLLGAISEPMNGTMKLGEITLNFDSSWDSYWTYQDGYFYYKTVLQPGETAQHLLTGVTLTNPTNENKKLFNSLDLDIHVSADVIQTVGNAFEVWGVNI
ncbi:MAG: SipW-dependent-type signal peptide-containing protein [Oscillospiraceae bacterium]